MSSPIPPRLTNPAGQPNIAASDALELDAFLSGLTAGRDALAIDASRGAPPVEVLEQIAAADAVHRELGDHGRRLRFTAATPGGRPGVELVDARGETVRRLSVAEAVEIAAGVQPAKGV